MNSRHLLRSLILILLSLVAGCTADEHGGDGTGIQGYRLYAGQFDPQVALAQADNGLIGAFNADETMIFATAWEPYQELFQGVGRCLHSDFRLGGLNPGERKEIRGKIYITTGTAAALLQRYKRDFPEHNRK